MAMTTEQGTTLLSRVGAGETVPDVLADMGISRPDFRAWRAENKAAFIGARQARRLATLNQRRTRAQAELDAIDAEIAEIESE